MQQIAPVNALLNADLITIYQTWRDGSLEALLINQPLFSGWTVKRRVHR